MRIYLHKENAMPSRKKSILFFPINGSGLGHLNRCLAYARHLPKDWRISFFSLSPVIEPLLKMGIEVEYFLSYFWTKNSSYFWNHELAIRLGMMLKHVCPDILVFDGTYPYQGLQWALDKYNHPIKCVWSYRGFIKSSEKNLNLNDEIFDLILQPGELDSITHFSQASSSPKAIVNIPPVTLFDREELLSREAARKLLNLSPEGKYILLSIASGNLKDIRELGHFLLSEVSNAGYEPVWLQSPLSIKPLDLPQGNRRLSIYPVAQYLKAFNGVIAAAGYNTCYEGAVTGLPTFFIPNEKLVDDQRRRAQILVDHKLGVLCEREEKDSMRQKLSEFFSLMKNNGEKPIAFQNGAKTASDLIEGLL